MAFIQGGLFSPSLYGRSIWVTTQDLCEEEVPPIQGELPNTLQKEKTNIWLPKDVVSLSHRDFLDLNLYIVAVF